jgi:hypothetical protein
VVLLAYLALNVIGVIYFEQNESSLFIPFYIIGVTALFVYVCWKKGEKLP